MDWTSFFKNLNKKPVIPEDEALTPEQQMRLGEPDMTEVRALTIKSDMAMTDIQNAENLCQAKMDELYNFINNFISARSEETDIILVNKYRAYMGDQLANWNYCKNLKEKYEKLEKIKAVCKDDYAEEGIIRTNGDGCEIDDFVGDLNDI